MEYRRLGRLGHESSVLIYGAAALAEVDQETRNQRTIISLVPEDLPEVDEDDDYPHAGDWSYIRDLINEGAIGKPEDIAAAVCFLAAPEARFITGTTLVVDGGRLDILA